MFPYHCQLFLEVKLSLWLRALRDFFILSGFFAEFREFMGSYMFLPCQSHLLLFPAFKALNSSSRFKTCTEEATCCGSEMVKECYRSYRSSSTFNSRIRMKTPQQVLFILFDKHPLQLSKVKETQLLGEISVLLLINVDICWLWYYHLDLSGMLSSKDSIPLAWLPLTFPRDVQTLLEEFPP